MNGENDKFWLDHQLAAARFLYELVISLFPVIRRPAWSSDRTFAGPSLTCFSHVFKFLLAVSPWNRVDKDEKKVLQNMIASDVDDAWPPVV